ncbi:protein serine/threonine phosphatase 2C [Leucogyrophana mollusca]|uniref:Protein serine/threonine phosphatase 2C n=1 Tax=Leucogyrophana mollusca TaxID=85980 RepID=A0ACB8BRT5_9AGAM|nr:protein serine/threonine phosphatase 2C [Leucogyrophana mollusca]
MLIYRSGDICHVLIGLLKQGCQDTLARGTPRVRSPCTFTSLLAMGMSTLLKRPGVDGLAESPPLAWCGDVPGSRCGPEDGPWPRPYKLLEHLEAWRQLAAAADLQSETFGGPAAKQWRAEGLNFQPFVGTRTQDRYIIQQLDIAGRSWTLTGVFDGHLGDATVDHAAYHMPIIIRDFLREMVQKHGGHTVPPPLIADMLSRAVTSFDEAIANDVLNLFPGGLETLSTLSNDEIRLVLNDQLSGGHNYKKARLCMYGTTALVALVDPNHEHLWLANLGDCQGIMVSEYSPKKWAVEVLTRTHNGENSAEVERVMREHPGESECVMDGRVLGAIAPFRCIGDTPFKQPPEFTRRILYNLYPGYHDTSPWEEFLVRNHTPPYISSVPEVTHYPLGATSTTQHPPRRYLLLCSDGLTDICGHQLQSIISEWAKNAEGPEGGTLQCMSLRLLWRALGNSALNVSRALTLDMDTPWLDDISIVVQTL